MTKQFPFSFLLIEKKQKIKTRLCPLDFDRQAAIKKLYSTFLSVRKVAKEACTEKEILKFPCVTLKENNSPAEAGSNRFSFLTLHFRKFFNEFLFRCRKKGICQRRTGLFEVGIKVEE